MTRVWRRAAEPEAVAQNKSSVAREADTKSRQAIGIFSSIIVTEVITDLSGRGGASGKTM